MDGKSALRGVYCQCTKRQRSQEGEYSKDTGEGRGIYSQAVYCKLGEPWYLANGRGIYSRAT